MVEEITDKDKKNFVSSSLTYADKIAISMGKNHRYGNFCDMKQKIRFLEKET